MPSKITSYDQLPPLQDWFQPDFEKGKIYWKVNRGRYHLKGKEAGTFQPTNYKYKETGPTGYWVVHTASWPYIKYLRRGKVLYYLKYGIWPLELDHISRNSLDDRIANLREVSRGKNMWNRATTAPGKELPYGVKRHINSTKSAKTGLPHKTQKPYAATASWYGRDKHLGYFPSAKEAETAYNNFYRQYYGKDLTVDYYTSVKQGDELWHFLRQNRATATMAYNLLRTGSMKDTIEKYKNQKTFTGNFYTERGKLLEPEARDIYSQVHHQKVYEVGGIINSKWPQAWYSPDGCVELDGLIEIKCFAEKHHLAVMEKVDPQIYAQMQFGLWVSEREWIDFVAFNPELEDIDKTFYTKRFYPDKKIHKRFEEIFRNSN